MTNLLLVRYSEPAWGPENPPSKWELTERGRKRSRLLGDYFAERGVGAVFPSSELKAAQTAEIAAVVAGLSNVVLVHDLRDLREHEREESQIIGDAERQKLVIDCIRRPDELIYGSEPVQTATYRFSAAVANLMVDQDAEAVAAVAHGTVIATFVGSILDIDPIPVRESLGLPGLIEIEWPDSTEIISQRNFD
jgi:broad specificity phosphatase PhoE